MIGSLPISITVGLLQVFTALCILAKQVVLGPIVPNYPTGAKRLRCALFILGDVLPYFGLEILQLA